MRSNSSTLLGWLPARIRADELKYNTPDILESGTGEDAHFTITPFEFNDYPGTGFEIACTISLCYEPFYTCSLPGIVCVHIVVKSGFNKKVAKLILSR